MPRTKLGQGFRNSESNNQAKTKTGKETQIEADLMADFEPTDRKNLTYLGKKQRTEERLEHLDKKLDEINTQLKADGVRVSIRKGSQNSLVLQRYRLSQKMRLRGECLLNAMTYRWVSLSTKKG